MKVLDQNKIDYEVVTYPADERDAAVLASTYFKVSPSQVFKTLVVPNKKNILALMPADAQLDLKKLAKIVGAKKLKMATHKEAETITSLKVGGISPLALLNKGFDIFADTSIVEQQAVYVSAGQKGINLIVPVDALLELTNAKTVELA